MDERAERIGRNEALFRRVNEEIEGLNEALAPWTGTFEVVCECGAVACVDQLLLTTDVYERVRSDPTLFVVSRGHAIPDVEDVVEESDEYEIVRKRPGDPARLATKLDERSS